MMPVRLILIDYKFIPSQNCNMFNTMCSGLAVLALFVNFSHSGPAPNWTHPSRPFGLNFTPERPTEPSQQMTDLARSLEDVVTSGDFQFFVAGRAQSKLSPAQESIILTNHKTAKDGEFHKKNHITTNVGDSHRTRRFQKINGTSQYLRVGKGGWTKFNSSDVMGNQDPPRDGVDFHGSHFICPPCSCSRTKNGLKIANCTHRKLTDLPDSLPGDIWSINMTFNIVREFNTAKLFIYPNLTEFDLSLNLLSAISATASSNISLKLIHLNVGKNSLREIQDGSFKSMPKLLTLLCSHNKLGVIRNSTFAGLGRLRRLDLSWNDIKYIEDAAFDPLARLRSLFLNNNPTLGYYPKRFGPRLVTRLTLLQHLHIQGNSNGDYMYPNQLLNRLHNLNELFVDGLGHGAEFGPQLKRLHHLTTLSFGPYAVCNLRNLSATFFQYVPHLKSLTFDHCRFRDFDPKAFHAIPLLETFSLQHITFDLDKAFQVLEGLQNSSIKSLSFVRLYHTTDACRTLSKQQGKYLRNLPHLLELNLSLNRLALLRLDFLKCIPTTLKRLILRGNKFTLMANLWGNIHFLKNLLEIDLSDQNMEHPTTGNAVDEDSHLVKFKRVDAHPDAVSVFSDGKGKSQARCGCNSISSKGFRSDTMESIAAEETMLTLPEDRSYMYSQDDDVTRNVILVPPNLFIVRASYYNMYGDIILTHRISQPNRLTKLIFDNSFMVRWGNGKLLPGVVHADFSHNHCKHLTNSFFHLENKLAHLSIQGNYLGDRFASDRKGMLFSRLGKLFYLDISLNMIFHLPTKFLGGLKQLRSLKISDNKLNVMDVELAHMPYLSIIDASKNSISWISKRTRDDLDAIASGNNVTLDLTKNPLPCTCAGIEVLQWMANTKVSFMNKDYLHCTNATGIDHRIGSLARRVKLLRRECTPNMALLTGCILCLGGFILAIAIGALAYKLRWRLIYSFNTGLLVRCFGFQPQGHVASKRKFDAYVVYADEDREFVHDQVVKELETSRGHRLCIEAREFFPGTLKFNNTVSAVQNSTVTLLVVSPAFVDSKELEYDMQMALIEEYESQETREVCKLLIYQQPSQNSMWKDLKVLMMKGRFLNYPTGEGLGSEAEHRSFWDRLSLEIGRSSITDDNLALMD